MKSSRVIWILTAACAALAALGGADAFAEPKRDAILADLLAQAKRAEPGFTGFSAQRGAAFFKASHKGGKPDTPSCTSCHTASPQNQGRTRAGKDIQPMAVSKNPARFTNPEDVEKWFARNCSSVLGRACTPREKGDFITFMMGQ